MKKTTTPQQTPVKMKRNGDFYVSIINIRNGRRYVLANIASRSAAVTQAHKHSNAQQNAYPYEWNGKFYKKIPV